MGNEKSNKLELNELVQNERNDVDIVEKLMGSMGRWQVCICFALMLCKIPIAWHQLSVLIIAPPIASFCIDNVTDTCSPNCSDIVFDRSLFTETIQSQWNLVCNKSQLPHVSQTLVLLGVFIGNLVFGMIADKFGRRKPLIAAVVIQSVGSIAAAFVPWFWIFSICRFIAALGTGGMIVTSFVLLIEIIGSKWRTHIAILFQIPFDLGQASLGLIGYFFRDWQQIQLVISIPPILLLSYYWILPESPRWLLLNKKAEDAIHVLRTAARFNKVQQHTIESDVGVTFGNGRMLSYRRDDFTIYFDQE
ncbi:hypothetical protein PPYR_04304 [Photinus pyralis]|uniref:Major facilitator superfamily (MFS) profile domain-containing protein n=2 Tax=Photinus pyralis TaxID=7054 RepID=A0A5N4AXZ5_PHOPY|nr:hypothetical protein PPYR_04304 [Photinus pyralis]